MINEMINAVLKPASNNAIVVLDPKRASVDEYKFVFAQERNSSVADGRSQAFVLDRTAWDFDMEEIWRDLGEDAVNEGNQPVATDLKPLLRLVLRCAASKGMPQPSITGSDNGGFEAFFKKSNRGLLIAGNPDLSLQAFGDYNGEIWRAKIDRSMPRSRPVTADQILWLMQRY